MASDTAAVPTSVERFFGFSLLGMLASGFFAVLGSGRLDAPTTVLTGLGLLLRGLLVAGWIRLPASATVVNIVTLAYICFYPLDYLYLSGEFIPATVHMIFFLAVVRVLTARTNRDYFFVKLVAFLELLAASVLSTSSNFFIFLCLFLLFGVATFASSEIRRSVQVPRRVIRYNLPSFHLRLGALTTCAGLGILVMTAGLFFLLPRTARAALAHLVPQRYHMAGFSGEINLGQTGELKINSTPVMHIKIYEGDSVPRALKWRGAALSSFDGRRWYNPPERPALLPIKRGTITLANYVQPWREGKRITYEVRLQALDSDVLFFTGVPEYVRIDLPSILRATSDNYRTGLGVSDGLHYIGFSRLDSEAVAASYRAEPLDAFQFLLYTRLPEIDPRIQLLALDVTRNERDTLARSKAIEKYLRSNYGYTTTLLSQSVSDPLANFLFERRKGHCEYFASAMAVMLRSLNIPARVVTGFQSGIYNEMTGWTIIRSGDAHSWVEAYVPGKGWVTFDPTPPDREGPLAAISTRMMLYVDAIETFWQEWVLDYNLEHQIRLAARMETSARPWNVNWLRDFAGSVSSLVDKGTGTARQSGRSAVALIFLSVLLLFGGPRFWKWLRREHQVRRIGRGFVQPHDAAILYARMLAILSRRGVEKPAWLTPLEFADVLPPSESSAVVAHLTQAYNELRYGGSPDAAGRMLKFLRDLERTA